MDLGGTPLPSTVASLAPTLQPQEAGVAPGTVMGYPSPSQDKAGCVAGSPTSTPSKTQPAGPCPASSSSEALQEGSAAPSDGCLSRLLWRLFRRPSAAAATGGVPPPPAPPLQYAPPATLEPDLKSAPNAAATGALAASLSLLDSPFPARLNTPLGELNTCSTGTAGARMHHAGVSADDTSDRGSAVSAADQPSPAADTADSATGGPTAALPGEQAGQVASQAEAPATVIAPPVDVQAPLQPDQVVGPGGTVPPTAQDEGTPSPSHLDLPTTPAYVGHMLRKLPAPQRHLFVEDLQADPLYACVFDAQSSEVAPSRRAVRDLTDGYLAAAASSFFLSTGSAPAAAAAEQAATVLTNVANSTGAAVDGQAVASLAGAGVDEGVVIDSVPVLPLTPPTAVVLDSGSAALRLSVTPEYQCYNEGEDNMRLVVSLEAQIAVVEEAAVALVCVLDVSGSMAGKPLELAKGTCHFLIDQMRSTDMCAFVTYNHQVREVLPLVKMTPAVQRLAHCSIAELQATGGTALYAGLVQGLASQRQAGLDDPKLVKAIFMCTDGIASTGFRTPDEILPALRQLQPAGDEVTVHTFGYGHRHSTPLLRAIAEAQRGNYYYIKDVSDIPAAYGDAFGGLRSVVAKSVTLTVTPLAPVQLTRVSRTDATRGASGALTVSWNELCAEESRGLLALLDLPSAPLLAPSAGAGAPNIALDGSLVAVVEVEYVSTETGRVVQLQCPVRVRRCAAPDAAERGAPAPIVLTTMARLQSAEAIESAAVLHTAGKAEAAQELLHSFAVRLRAEHIGMDGETLPTLVDMYLRQVVDAKDSLLRSTEASAKERTELLSRAFFSSDGLRSERAANAGLAYNLPSNIAYDNAIKAKYRETSSASVEVLRSAVEPLGGARDAASTVPQQVELSQVMEVQVHMSAPESPRRTWLPPQSPHHGESRLTRDCLEWGKSFTPAL